MATSPCQPSSSPKWIRPTEVLCMRRKARRPSNSALQLLDNNVLANRQSGFIPSQEDKLESFNPFRKIALKRKIEYVLQENSESFDGLLPIEKSDEAPTINKQDISNWMPVLFDESANSAHLKPKLIVKESFERISQLPLDWSLKTRLRFMSATPFTFRGSLNTCEEASGTTGFVRCIHSSEVQEWSVDTSANAKFHQQCLVWQHPALPWLKLFPRTQEQKSSQISIFASNQALQDSVHEDWSESLQSLFQLVRARQCPFFYLCGNSFTVLFRAAGVNGLSDTHALLTPTTSGIRKVLRLQGIEFTMPLCPKAVSQELDTSDDPALGFFLDNDKNCNISDNLKDDEEPGIFLESLGLSQQDFPSLNPKRRKLEQDGIHGNIDLLPESLVCLEGRDTLAFLNFLLENRSGSLCIPTTGPLAGVPPTLLAPCAFPGAVLKRVKARQGWVKQGNETMHCIDLSGPILPNMVQGLTSLFSTTQEGSFSAVLASEPSTASFTFVPSDRSACMPSAFATENLKDCGLASEFLTQICSCSEKALLHEIDAQNKLFSWR